MDITLDSLGLEFLVCQGLLLSPLLFILVFETLSCEFRTGILRERLYKEDYAVVTDSFVECIAQLKDLNNGMEDRRLRVNMIKTKFMIASPGLDAFCDLVEYPRTVFHTGVSMNPVQCSQCKLSLHKKFCGVKDKVTANPDNVRTTRHGSTCMIDERLTI